MALALVLTEDLAAERGYAGPGPFTFAGLFPGVYFVGQPVRISELGLSSEEEALDRVEASNVPLELVEVGEGEGDAFRWNHAPSAEDVRRQSVDELVEEVAGGSSLRSHADADAVAQELGVEFADGTSLADKRSAIEAARSGGDVPNPPEAGEPTPVLNPGGNPDPGDEE